jgi:transcriptional regulator with GAF, ATPase, and Fis domain
MDQTEYRKKPVDTAAAASGNLEAEKEAPIRSLRTARAQGEIEAILAALKRTGWNRKQAARLLSISYRGLLYKIRRHNITAA